jgi:hypothetical protein
MSSSAALSADGVRGTVAVGSKYTAGGSGEVLVLSGDGVRHSRQRRRKKPTRYTAVVAEGESSSK